MASLHEIMRSVAYGTMGLLHDEIMKSITCGTMASLHEIMRSVRYETMAPLHEIMGSITCGTMASPHEISYMWNNGVTA